ncbi:MAG TPA: glycosyltransferase family 4 protein [Isosphaeraceae bacterium]|jgi:glycosyltransferase involved in cell wall biosynthesis|nr:glycosyltransferase family 4 protein [Isosphaeraceae bacterium]
MATTATTPATTPAPPARGPWVIVTGDFTPLGGMDRCNHALACYLARRRGAEVHLVTHRAWPDLLALPGVHLHQVPRPFGRHMLGYPLLDHAGRHWARRLSKGGARVVVNGGNCRWHDINWVHYVHAAWTRRQDGGPARRLKAALLRRYDEAAERASIGRSRLVVANSERTRRDVIEHLGVPPERVHTVYLGTDPARFGPIGPAERARSRAKLGWDDDRPTVAFVGALADVRKGFDTLFEAWRRLASASSWDARLAVVGAGGSLPYWKAKAADAGLGGSIEFLGFRDDVPEVLAACDALASPVRYEPFGLNVQEALCRGLPALVTATAGVAERYPAELAGLLLPDPDDAADLADRLRDWRGRLEGYRAAVAPLGAALRGWDWDRCAAAIVDLAEAQGAP